MRRNTRQFLFPQNFSFFRYCILSFVVINLYISTIRSIERVCDTPPYTRLKQPNGGVSASSESHSSRSQSSKGERKENHDIPTIKRCVRVPQNYIYSIAISVCVCSTHILRESVFTSIYAHIHTSIKCVSRGTVPKEITKQGPPWGVSQDRSVVERLWIRARVSGRREGEPPSLWERERRFDHRGLVAGSPDPFVSPLFSVFCPLLLSL